MSNTPAQWSQAMLATLAVTAPGASFALGTPERKIVDAVGEALSEASIDQYLIGSLMDIDTKAGLELEQFVGIFGFGRLAGKAAVGEVTISMGVATTVDTTIALNSQFYTSPSTAGNNQLFFSATQAVIIPAGNTRGVVPVQCTTVGAIGNVGAGQVNFLAAAVGAASCTNLSPMTGGVDVESDTELRQRFKDTLLRNVAGTSDWYLGLAQQNSNVSRVTVFGPTTLYRTQIAVPGDLSGGTPGTLNLPVAQDVKYVWPGMTSCYQNLGSDGETFYSPVDDYTLTSGVSPAFSRIASGLITPGEIVDLEFQYTDKASRNDPLNGITNKVDMFVEGADPYSVQERTVVTSATLNGTTLGPDGTAYHSTDFARVGDTTAPASTNRFMRLGSVPILDFPSSLTVDGVVYQQGVHYHLLKGTTLTKGSKFEISGIEWESSGPAAGTEITVSYVYNRVPEVLQSVIDTSKQICTDVMVHSAGVLYIEPCLNIEYGRAYALSVVNNAINVRLQAYFQGLGFGAQIHISTMLLAVQQVLGVDSVSLTTVVDNPSVYGVRAYNHSGDTVPTGGLYTGDFKINGDTLPQFVSTGAIITRQANP